VIELQHDPVVLGPGGAWGLSRGALRQWRPQGGNLLRLARETL